MAGTLRDFGDTSKPRGVRKSRSAAFTVRIYCPNSSLSEITSKLYVQNCCPKLLCHIIVHASWRRLHLILFLLTPCMYVHGFTQVYIYIYVYIYIHIYVCMFFCAWSCARTSSLCHQSWRGSTLHVLLKIIVLVALSGTQSVHIYIYI